MIRIVPLTNIAPTDIEALLDAAFGTDRHARTAYKIRAGTRWIPALSFAARDETNALLGLLQSWPVGLTDADGAQHPITLVGPVAVLPEHQRAGIGRMMMDALMDVVKTGATGGDAMAMIGDPEYYERFYGFSAATTTAWSVPGPVERHRLLAKIARAGGLPKVGTLEPRV